MLELKIAPKGKPVVLRFEHSLLSLSKWESKTQKPFLGTAVKSSEELIDYFQCMLVTPPDPELVLYLEPEQQEELANYINMSLTASSVPRIAENSINRETVTSELIYYWLVALKIPFDVEKWHLSRLMKLIEITQYKSTPPDKQNKAKVWQNWREENARRLAAHKTKG